MPNICNGCKFLFYAEVAEGERYPHCGCMSGPSKREGTIIVPPKEGELLRNMHCPLEQRKTLFQEGIDNLEAIKRTKQASEERK